MTRDEATQVLRSKVVVGRDGDGCHCMSPVEIKGWLDAFDALGILKFDEPNRSPIDKLFWHGDGQAGWNKCSFQAELDKLGLHIVEKQKSTARVSGQ